MKAVAVISQQVSRGGPDQQVDGKGTREEALDRTVEPVGRVATSLDVREQGGGLGNRTKVLSVNNCNKSCFTSREFEKPAQRRASRVNEDGPDCR